MACSKCRAQIEEAMMSTAAVVVIVVVIVLLVLAVLVAVPMMRRRQLKSKFGPEYDRAVQAHEDRAAAERELRDRERRHTQLEIRPLAADARERYSQQWAQVQERFVDDPASAVAEADELVTALMAERGYPTDGYEQQLADLSIDHSRTLDHYRTAHDTRQRVGGEGASTEDLREAMVHYRALFEDLLRHETAR
jgi:hypothetical protein